MIKCCIEIRKKCDLSLKDRIGKGFLQGVLFNLGFKE